jgi:predicted histone-like DNA-binding protein
MPIKYDFYPTPNPDSESDETMYHPRVVSLGTLSTQMIAEQIQYDTTLTLTDIIAVLSALSRSVANRLKNSQHIHLNGIGYFQLAITAPPTENPTGGSPQEISIKCVRYQADKQLKEQLLQPQFVRADRPVHSPVCSKEEVDEWLTQYFATNDNITTQQFHHLYGFTKMTAYRRLRQLVKESKLYNSTIDRFPLYRPSPGYYGAPPAPAPASSPPPENSTTSETSV